MSITWIVAANSSKAKIFSVDKIKFSHGKEKLNLIEEVTHPESRKRDLEIVSDKVGHFMKREAGGRGSFVGASDPQKHEAESFAREVVETLEIGRVDNLYQDLILVVPPTFYGYINKQLHEPLRNMISQVIEKDYTKDDEKSLEKHLRQQLLS